VLSRILYVGGLLTDFCARSIHVVSQLHAVIIIPFAYRCLGLVSLDQDRAFGWDSRAGTVQAIACGCVLLRPFQLNLLWYLRFSLLCHDRYFLWDTLDAIINFISIGFVIHGALKFEILEAWL
jgi:hypothetical protein